MQESQPLSEELENSKIGTYEKMISNQILNQIGLSLNPNEIQKGLEDKSSRFYSVLRVPMALSLNALILAQIKTYKLFCQKKIADYLILTNPSQMEQQQQDFEDFIPKDILEFKSQLLEKQQELRNKEQLFYDDLALSQATLKKEVRQQIIEFGEFVGNFNELTTQKLSEISARAAEQKSELIETRRTWKNLAALIASILADKGVVLYTGDQEYQQIMDLNFLQNLGEG